MSFAAIKLALAALVLAQTDQKVLERAQTRVLETLDRLPRYVCMQTTDRKEFHATKRTTHSCAALLDVTAKPIRKEPSFSDKLRLDVSLYGDKELFSWIGANHFHEKGLFDLVGGGPLSTGSFGSFLAAIFRTDHPEISSAGALTWNGQAAYKFEFRVPVDRSNYTIGPPQAIRRTGYKGWFLVRADNSDLMHLVIETDQPPTETGVCGAETTLDYNPVQIRNSIFLLPRETNLKILDQDATEDLIHTAYTACHEFVGESILSFGTATSASVDTASQPPDTLIPAHQAFTSVLAQNINTADAAAGDLVFLRTVTDIRNWSKEIVVPAGSRLTGRLVRMQFSYAYSPVLLLAIKLESVEVAGKSLSLTAQAITINGKRNSLSLMESGHLALLRVPKAKPGYLVKKGMKIEWITAPA